MAKSDDDSRMIAIEDTAAALVREFSDTGLAGVIALRKAAQELDRVVDVNKHRVLKPGKAREVREPVEHRVVE